MDRILILALLIGLASAQINFSTSWGKRSSPTGPSLPLLRQPHHSSRKESLVTIQPLAESYPASGVDVDEQMSQRATLIPPPCLSLLKSLLLVNQIVENEMLRMEKYGRQQQQQQQQQDAIQSTGILTLSDP